MEHNTNAEAPPNPASVPEEEEEDKQRNRMHALNAIAAPDSEEQARHPVGERDTETRTLPNDQDDAPVLPPSTNGSAPPTDLGGNVANTEQVSGYADVFIRTYDPGQANNENNLSDDDTLESDIRPRHTGSTPRPNAWTAGRPTMPPHRHAAVIRLHPSSSSSSPSAGGRRSGQQQQRRRQPDHRQSPKQRRQRQTTPPTELADMQNANWLAMNGASRAPPRRLQFRSNNAEGRTADTNRTKKRENKKRVPKKGVGGGIGVGLGSGLGFGLGLGLGLG